MKIKNNITDILANSIIEGNNLFLPKIQLERNIYLDVNKVLMAIGGKWNRKIKAHIFNISPNSIIEQILLTGEYTDQKKEYQFFETPENLAKKLINMADIQKGESILEPSAGKGNIAQFIDECNCIELNKTNYDYLIEKGLKVVGKDFFSCNTKYDVIIANPPFSKQQDIDHVLHMIKLARRKIVSVMSASVMFRSNKKTVEFRNLINDFNGTINLLPENSFQESGTKVNTCVVCIEKNLDKC